MNLCLIISLILVFRVISVNVDQNDIQYYPTCEEDDVIPQISCKILYYEDMVKTRKDIV